MNEKFMKQALLQAQLCEKSGDVPVGAIIVKNGNIIATGRNRREETGISSLHAEIDAINNASKTLGGWNLSGCTMYVTLEPCPMCAGAILMSRLDKVVFGAYEEKFGAVGSKLNLFYDYRFNHNVKFCGGILEEECGKILQNFFLKKRSDILE